MRILQAAHHCLTRNCRFRYQNVLNILRHSIKEFPELKKRALQVVRDRYNVFDSANESITLLASDSNGANSSEVESERGAVAVETALTACLAPAA
jgi:hypothetical protein